MLYPRTSILFSLDEVDLVAVFVSISISRDNEASILDLLDRETPIKICPPIGSGPEGIPMGIGLDEVDLEAVLKRIGRSGDNEASILSLLDRVTPIAVRPPVGLGPEGIPTSVSLDQVDI
jgi:hypothetical protein